MSRTHHALIILRLILKRLLDHSIVTYEISTTSNITEEGNVSTLAERVEARVMQGM